jgi:hypothetical protein
MFLNLVLTYIRVKKVLTAQLKTLTVITEIYGLANKYCDIRYV